MQNTITQLIEQLSQAETAPDCYNEYAPDSPYNAIRRQNLARYLTAMVERQPKTLLVLEAPGYRGCRLTGVPVTSRKILLEGIPELDMFGEAAGYQRADDPGFERIYGEQSATILWNTLVMLKQVPLIWNTFPFHPHKAEQPLTNRKPRKPETQLGAEFLQTILDMYQPTQIIAVGNVAYDTLAGIGISCDKVRHPAQGGKNDFVAGLTAQLKNEAS